MSYNSSQEEDDSCCICGGLSSLGVHCLGIDGKVFSRYFCDKHANDFRRGKLDG